MLPTTQIFSLTTKLVFGLQSIRELPMEGRVFGTKVIIVSGKNALIDSGTFQRVETLLQTSGIETISFSEVEPEPSLETVKRGLALARERQVDWVIGLGGGSAMDAAKAIAGLYHAAQPVDYYFADGEIETPGIPLITIPTTAGSGGEVTFNAVLTDTQTKIKKSIRNPLLAAKVAIVDPQLTFSMPLKTTIDSGMDALVQAIEAFTSKGANPVTDIYAYSAIERIGGNILKVFQDGQNVEARVEMSTGSLMAGVALSNARLGAVHGLAHAVGTHTGKPHGLVCAVLLVPVMRFNLAVSFAKYALIAKALGHSAHGGDELDAAAAGVKTIMILEKKIGIPSLESFGLQEDDYQAIVAESLSSGSLKANPREATAEDLLNILKGNF